MLTEYETTVVVRPDVGGDTIESTLDRIRDTVSQGGGKLLAINHWGKKKLAYEINKHSRGIYVHTHYLGGFDLVAEIERNLRISDNVLRFLTVKLQDAVTPEERQAQEYVKPEYDAEEAAPEEERYGAPEGGEQVQAAGERAQAAGEEAAPEAQHSSKAAPNQDASEEEESGDQP